MARIVSPAWIMRVRLCAEAAGLRAPENQWFTIAVLMKWRLGRRYMGTDRETLRDAIKGFAATYHLRDQQNADVPDGLDIVDLSTPS